MRMLTKLVMAAAVLAVSGTASQAAINLTTTNGAGAVSAPSALTLVTNFNTSPISSTIASGFSFSGGTLETGTSASTYVAPAFDTTQYLAVLGNRTATLAYSGPGSIEDLSLYIGSLDSYNKITFYGTGAFSGAGESLLGSQLVTDPMGSPTDANDNQRFNFTFTGGAVNEVVFYSGFNSLEFDNIAAAVPEPATWAMMIVGLGFIGFMLRNNRKPKNQALMA
jgi:PEP-CTERM motif